MQNFQLFYGFIFGSLVGSFLNVVIWRLPREEKISGRSKCVHCGHKLAAWELIPILSFAALRGRCRRCKKKISWRYPVIEIVSGLLAMYAVYYQQAHDLGAYLVLARRLLIAYTLLVVLVVDLEHFLILDKVIFPSLLALIAINLVLDIRLDRDFLHLYSRFLPGIVVGLLSALPFFLLWFFSKGKWMGFGDIKLMLFLGNAFAWPLIAVNVLLGVFAGGLAAIFLLLFKKKHLGDKIALGAFLSASGIVTIFFGPTLWFMYLSLLGV